MLAAEGPKEQPVTLEYRGIVEQQLTEVNYYCCFSLSAFSDDVLLWEKQNVSRNEQIFCSKAHCKLIISPNAG